MVGIFKKVFNFYYQGFRSMKVGKKLWLIIIVKLFVMFAVLKVFFFKDYLSEKFDSDEKRSEFVIDQLTR